ncbi:MAG: hypothetical protein N2509_06445 [Treponemataceae bacterium]|nr:hypothetical protein [Treponemataceae bacterium]
MKKMEPCFCPFCGEKLRVLWLTYVDCIDGMEKEIFQSACRTCRYVFDEEALQNSICGLLGPGVNLS